MASPVLRGLIQAGFDVLTTTVSAKTKKILAQLGSVRGETTDSDAAEWWQHVGFASRPSKPIAKTSAAQTIKVSAADRDLCVASQDLRGLELYGSLDFGETCLYAPGETGTAQARIVLKKDGSIHLYTRQGNTSTGGGMVVQVDAANDAIRLLNSQGYGLIIDGDGITLTTGTGALTIASSGNVKLVGTGTAQLDGTSVTLGSIAAPGVNSVCVGPAGIAGVGSTKVFAALA